MTPASVSDEELAPLSVLSGAVAPLPSDDQAPEASWTESPMDAQDARDTVRAAAVGWLGRNLSWFDPERWARHLPIRGFPPTALLELLIASRCLRRGGVPGGAALDRAAADLARQVTSRPAFAEGLLKGDEALGHYLWLLALMIESGQPDGGLLAAGRRLIEAGEYEVSNPGRSAAAMLERRYILDLAGIEYDKPGSEELYRRTAIGPGADPVQLRDSDVYVFTHMLYYLTDFGDRELGLEPGERRRVGELTEVLLGRFLMVGDRDLSAELLGCAELTGVGSSALTAAGWRALARSIHPDGAVPGPLYLPARAAGLTGDKERAYQFGTWYHTTIAAVISAAIAADDHG